ncbi:MAG: class I adenylate-forming enzyme family protein [Hyphomicrobiaceae bacterium]
MPTIDSVLTRARAATPDAIAVHEWDSGRTVTYADLDDRVSMLAGFLRARGIRHGARVGLHLPNGADFLTSQFGALRAGTVATYINHRLLPAEAARQAAIAEAAAVITTAERAEAFRDDPALRRALIIIAGSSGVTTLGPSLADVLAAPGDGTPLSPAGIQDDDAILRFTSGTTGRPKGVVVSHRQWLIRATSILAEEIRVERGSTTMVLGPLSHQAGLFVLPTFMRRGTLLVFERFDLESVRTALVSQPVARTQMVPTMLKMFLQDRATVDVIRRSGLSEVIYGGSPIEAGVLAQALDDMPKVDFVQVYGSHEAGSISCLDGPDSRNPLLRSSAGRPFLAAAVRIAAPKDGGGWGEIEVSAPWTPRARLTENGREAVDTEWIGTGDLGEIHEGYIYLKDRANDVIVSGGFNVYPSEVEDTINRCPGVISSAVVSAPDPKWGERVIAFVITSDRSVMESGALEQHCRAHLANFKVPKEFHPIAEIPVNPNGKPDRRRLGEPYWRGRERRIN